MGEVFQARAETARSRGRLESHPFRQLKQPCRQTLQIRGHAGKLKHPNVVTIYDADEADGAFYIAMEYVEGTTWPIGQGDGPLPVATAWNMPASGLGCSRPRKRPGDRDIKPSNLIVTQALTETASAP